MPDVTLTLPEIINQLQTQWGGDEEGRERNWEGTTINYALLQSPAGDPLPSEWAGITAMDATQMAFIRDAFEMWDDLIAINLTESSDTSQITVGYTSTTDGGGTYTSPKVVTVPIFDEDIIVAEHLWLSTSWEPLQSGNLSYGTYGLETMIHEIGHALGLSHPGSYNADDKPPPTYETSAEYLQDTRQYTLMSYFEAEEFDPGIDRLGAAEDGVNLPYANAATPLLHDIAAIQEKYGADFTTRATNTTYGFNSTADRLAFDFTVNKNPVIAIWDGGGTDTLDCSGYIPDGNEAYNQFIDLGAGKFSSIGALTSNVAIAFNCVIENAIGGGGDDDIQGNSVDNWLSGGAGGDVLLGLDGNDTLLGGTGADQLFGHKGNDTITGGDGSDLINGGGGFDTSTYDASVGEIVTITPQGAPKLGLWSVTGPAQGVGDVLAGIEAFVFGEGGDRITLLNADGRQRVTLDGAGGDDIITGANDEENLIGGWGSDVLAPQKGLFNAFGGFYSTLLATWVESFADNDLLVLDRHFEKADYSFISNGTVWTGTDGSTARGIARILYTGSDFKDTVWGAQGVDQLTGNGGDDSLFGFNGNDGLEGGDGNDRLEGGIGDDLLIGELGNDVLAGEAGNDVLRGGLGVDLLVGGAGNDRIETGGGGDLEVLGQDGNDTLIGSDDAEVLDDGNDGDTISGFGGNDRLVGGNGNDILKAGDGDDAIYAGSGVESIDGGAGFDTLVIERGTTSLGVTFAIKGNDATVGDDGTSARNVELLFYYGGSGDDDITGFDFNDYMEGNAGADRLTGGGGADRLLGGAGDDVLSGGDGIDILLGGDDNDTLRGGLGADTLWGGNGNDRIETGGGGDLNTSGQDGDDTLIGSDDIEAFSGGNGNDRIDAQGGNDTLNGDAGDDTLLGGGGDDQIVTGLGVEKVDGGDGFDTLIIDRTLTVLGVTLELKGAVASTGSDGTSVVNVERLLYTGGSGDDKITGFDANDVLTGNGGVDKLDGGNGNDVLVGGAGEDVITGGDGSDNLSGGTENDILKGGLGADSMTGGSGNDRLETGGGAGGTAFGEDGDDILIGGDDNEFLSGGADFDTITAKGGDDALVGDAGNDTLSGGLGNDTLTGGLDSDTFIFQDGAGIDTVTDFDSDPAGGQDTLDVTAFNYAGFAAMLADGVTILASGINTVINFGADRPVVTLTGVAVASIDASDFLI